MYRPTIKIMLQPRLSDSQSILRDNQSIINDIDIFCLSVTTRKHLVK